MASCSDPVIETMREQFTSVGSAGAEKWFLPSSATAGEHDHRTQHTYWMWTVGYAPLMMATTRTEHTFDGVERC